MKERTLSIIKPDAVKRNLIGKIIAIFEQNGLRIAGMRMIRLSHDQAAGFYAVHKGKEFFEPLLTYMTSGPCVVMVLEGEDAIAKNRRIMGKTNPEEAEEGTIRRLFAENTRRNSVHGSDSQENACSEIAYFFRQTEILED